MREACRSRPTGKAQWTSGFVTELLRRGIPLALFADEDLPPPWQRLIGERSDVTIIHPKPRGSKWHLEVARMLVREKPVDLYVSPTSYIVPAIVGRKFPCVPIVHDLIAFRGEPHDRKAVIIERMTLGGAVSRSPLICTVSEATKRDLRERYVHLPSENVATIFAGPTFASSGRSTPDGRTILCLGTLSPRKNQLRLIQAYASLPEDLRASSELVLVGSRGWDDAEIVKLASGTSGVKWMDYVPDAEVESLLSRTTILAFPSLYEGFGMPVLDAFNRGIPVLTSHGGSLAEVAGDAAEIIDPLLVPSIAQGLERLLVDSDLRELLTERGLARAELFSWKRTVDLFLEAVSRLPQA